MKVIWTNHATADLVEIYAFIARDSVRYAQQMVDRITRRSIQLAKFPDSGAVVSKFARDDIREVLEGSYRLIYQRTESQIAVLTVLHGARKLTDLPASDT